MGHGQLKEFLVSQQTARAVERFKSRVAVGWGKVLEGPTGCLTDHFVRTGKLRNRDEVREQQTGSCPFTKGMK